MLDTLSHVLYELSVYVLGLLCLWHAWRQGRQAVLLLLTGIVYGTLIEYTGLSLKTLPQQDYTYGWFMIMFFRDSTRALPLCIVVGWGLIIYAAMQTTQQLDSVPWLARPFIGATLALSLDLMMDPVASSPTGLQMWVWQAATDTQWWMKVPLSNFAGWYTVIVTFSFCTLLGWRLLPPSAPRHWGNAVAPILAMPGGVGLNLLSLRFYVPLIWKKPWEPLYVLLLLAIGLGLFLRYALASRRGRPIDYVVLSIPMFFQLYFLAWLLIAGVYHDLPGMLVAAPLILLLSLIGFAWPYLPARNVRISAVQT